MNTGDVARFAELFGIMRDLELALESFYTTCAAAFGDDAGLWALIATEERKHADNLERMIDFVAERPERFSWGRTLQPAAVQTAISGVTAVTERVGRGEVSFRSALALARDYEKALLENRYAEVLRGDDPAYVALVAGIVEQTRVHKSRIDDRIAALGKG